MPYHKILERQIQKKLSPDHLADPAICEFLELVDKSYANFERDKQISEHAFAISEKEYQEVLQNLQVQNQIKAESIKKLKDAIASLDANATLSFNREDDELISVITYLEQQLKKSKELETALVRAKEMAEEAARAKSDFLSVMSHEIRTPLNAIIGIIHLMLHDELLPSQEEHLNTLNISAENLLNLINDILDFGKIEEGKIVFSEKNMDVRRLVTNLRLANRIRGEEKGNKIKILIDEDLPAFVKGDELRLGQILNNLITNAIKFTRNGTIVIEVHVKRTTGEGTDVYFSVSDTGIGIDKEKQLHIFERFTQANSDITRQFGGSGLGLTIVKKLLTLQNSDIHLESEPGKGSTFFFTIFFKKGDDQVPEETRSVPQTDLSGIKVLLVDDVEFNILVAEKMLRNRNAIVEVAANGMTAIEKAQKEKFDIILMDLQMPIMDGYRTAGEIRSFDSEVPIVALTASASTDIQQKALDHGMIDYLAKPFKPNDLYEVVYKYGHSRRKTTP